MCEQTYYRLIGLFEIEALKPEKIWMETDEYIFYMPNGFHGHICSLSKDKLFTSIAAAAEEAYAIVNELIIKQYDKINTVEQEIKHLEKERDKLLQKML